MAAKSNNLNECVFTARSFERLAAHVADALADEYGKPFRVHKDGGYTYAICTEKLFGVELIAGHLSVKRTQITARGLFSTYDTWSYLEKLGLQEPPAIRFSSHRPVEHITRDIIRRLLPLYTPIWEKVEEARNAGRFRERLARYGMAYLKRRTGAENIPYMGRYGIRGASGSLSWDMSVNNPLRDPETRYEIRLAGLAPKQILQLLAYARELAGEDEWGQEVADA